jgi:hypothetical protein
VKQYFEDICLNLPLIGRSTAEAAVAEQSGPITRVLINWAASGDQADKPPENFVTGFAGKGRAVMVWTIWCLEVLAGGVREGGVHYSVSRKMSTLADLLSRRTDEYTAPKGDEGKPQDFAAALGLAAGAASTRVVLVGGATVAPAMGGGGGGAGGGVDDDADDAGRESGAKRGVEFGAAATAAGAAATTDAAAGAAAAATTAAHDVAAAAACGAAAGPPLASCVISATSSTSPTSMAAPALHVRIASSSRPIARNDAPLSSMARKQLVSKARAASASLSALRCRSISV